MTFLQKFASIDFAAAIGAGGWAIAAQHVPSMEVLASPEVAGGFALLALGRWYVASKSK